MVASVHIRKYSSQIRYRYLVIFKVPYPKLSVRNTADPNPKECLLSSRADLEAELVLNGHDDLHMVQAVQPQVLDEVAAQRHLSPQTTN
jgi:hypothetical protein